MLDALSPPRRRLVLGASAVAISVVLVISLVAVVRASTAARPVPQDSLGPVLLVPGYGGTGVSLARLRSTLEADGREVRIVTPVDDGTGDLNAAAQNLAEVAEQTRTDAGAESVDVVGYSAGGVVARLWVRSYGGATVARRVLTLGSPQHGTSVAALAVGVGGCPVACEQLVPDSDLLRTLNAGDETPAGPEWVTIRSTADQVVTPVDSASLDGALNLVVQDICPGSTAGHPDLPSDPVVLAALASTLGTAAPVTPTAVSC